MSFTDDERQRYARHILLKEFGGPGQQRLKAATVAIVGVGGLGSAVALYLAAAGIGRLRLIDDDDVSLSNLQRQIAFTSDDIGIPKVASASEAIAALNQNVDLDPRRTRITDANAAEMLAGADLVLDGTDDFVTRFAVNAACRALGVTLISGAVGRWSGQVSTFKRGGPCYRCLVPDTPPDAETCAQVGIVGALTGVIGSIMALEAIKEIAGAGEGLAGRLLLYDGLAATSRTIALRRDPACPVCSHE
ncbi:HesA/MoeB/ThiF family protein [Terricaulis silvestris]|uniref:Molybdopterin-synthase adenylyltransferase n=1 Tax=Terricaulis silvestris TaxID=2686094 RepID=A0A6I6MZP9_9CAUL|nr:HesA/MoeB/ThiF family protein [Terricaulis silvestris]QGZ97122.1 Molybdopterin-synthase adenylyltransferase [Terricaulis silvestris]